MKRSLMFVLSILLAFSLTACHTAPSTLPTATPNPTAVESEPVPTPEPIATETPEATPQEKNITLSASLLEMLWKHQESFDLEAYAAYLTEWETITEANVQPDGSVMVSLTAENHEKLLDELHRQLLDTENVAQDGLELVEANEDCTEMQLFVNKKRYETGYNRLFVTQKQFEAVQWQAFSGSWNGELETRVLDADTGVLLETVELDNLWDR